MNVLITGGYGFIGSATAERLSKEGCNIFIVDNLSSNAVNNLKIKHTFYQINAGGAQCEDVFRINNIDVVVHLAVAEVTDIEGLKANQLGLTNVLAMAQKYEAKQVICAFSAFFSPDAKLLAHDGRPMELPVSPEKAWHTTAVNYCLGYRRLYGMNVAALFLSNVYGPRQKKGVLSEFVERVFHYRPLVVYGDGRQTRDFIHVDDVADAIYRMISRNYQGERLTVSSNSETAVNDCLEIFKELTDLKVERAKARPGDIVRMSADSSACREELGWRIKYDIKKGIIATCYWYKNNLPADTEDAAKAGKGALWKNMRPYVENLAFFGVMVLLSVFVYDNSIVDPNINLDYNFVYILTMGVLYGKKQSIPATALSAILLSYNIITKYDDFVSMIYKTEYIVHFSAYFFFGILSGYITDNRERLRSFLERDVAQIKERYKFLERIYLENVNAKNRLYKQIVNSEDTLGSTYRIIKKLDNVNVEGIFTVAGEVLSEITGTEHLAVYSFGSNNKYYLRQKIRLGYKTVDLPKSLKVEAYEYLRNMLADRQLFVNKMLTPGLPDMAAPVLRDGEVIAVIQLYDLSFEDLNLYKQDLLQVTTRLISDALNRAYLYEAQAQDKKYLPDTRILIADEFAKIQREIYKNRLDRYDYVSAFTLKIITQEENMREISDKMLNVLREEDFIGLDEEGKINVILWNIDEDMIPMVQKRIKNIGFDCVRVSEHEQ
ncbi:MAG: NAD-dependent epimerase/dehydratase family protein [Acidaminococcales bacterium]|jgi:nucleoside-diphosphate-sugar epimerase|nr:NAD-dependent epimerase/dehydratase family protein [Acidaminococcales bacterium]